MVAIIETPVTMDDLVAWEACKAELAKLKSKEALLRNRIFGHFFPNPVEGTNKVPLAQGWQLKATYSFTRKYDVGMLTAATEKGGRFIAEGFDVNPLVDWVPELNMKNYRALPDTQRKLLEEVLIIKPGMPQMEIVLPAAAKKAMEAKAAKAALS